MKRLFQSASSDKLSNVETLFQQLLMGVALMAGAVHVLFGGLFYANGIVPLAVLNVACVLCYVLVFLLLRRCQVTASMTLVVTEVLFHAAFASWAIGWSSSFHMYAMLVPPVMVLSSLPLWRVRMPSVLAVVALYVGGDLLLRTATPAYELSAGIVTSLHYFNVLTVMAFLVFLSGCYLYFVREGERRLRVMASSDPLTGLRNRRSLLEEIDTAVGAGRSGVKQSISFVLCDLDFFKTINDEYGHAQGDAVIKDLAQVLRAEARAGGGRAARWGGEEFLLFLPSTTSASAMLVASRIREAVQIRRIEGPAGVVSVTVSLGVSTMHLDESVEQAIERADQALYSAKASGRNRVELAAGDAFFPGFKTSTSEAMLDAMPRKQPAASAMS